MTDKKQLKEPLFQVSKKVNDSWKHTALVKGIAIIVGLIIGSILCSLSSDTGKTPINFFIYLFKGALAQEESRAEFLKNALLLLMTSFALLPAFKMKFWNLGGNGQIAMGALVAIIFMKFMGGNAPDWLVITLMLVGGILAGAIWAVIPAIFKALFKTNESLFTLMMNYIAVGLVGYFITVNHDRGSDTISSIPFANINIPSIKYSENWICGIIAILVVGFIITYLKFSKHGFETSIVGESENTARYVGVNVKKVIIRTVFLSGAICGLVGALLVGSIQHTIIKNIANNMGFTGIMVAWMGKLNPIMMIIATFLIAFLNKGLPSVNTNFDLSNKSLSDLILGIVYFCIIASEFFIEYAIKIHKKNLLKNTAKEVNK